MRHRASDEQQRRKRADANRRYDHRWAKVARAYIAQHPICEICSHNVSAECDHIEPHRGDEAKFWNFNNLQALCKSCHSRKTAYGG